VWYMGDDTIAYEYDSSGALVGTDTAGSWEAGVGGALPGFIIEAAPATDDTYQQELLATEAEDRAMVLRTGVTVTLTSGTQYTNCVQTIEWSPLEPTALEYKYYEPTIGLVLETNVEGKERVELHAISP
ncbi:MAG: hypothetical protein H6841_11580, partial [Planctomycetes bacterium]|nr:hypothetical protein [Planctomycetota bacterium]